MLAGGTTILCGKYLGRNEQDRVQNVFSLNLVIALLMAITCCLHALTYQFIFSIFV